MPNSNEEIRNDQEGVEQNNEIQNNNREMTDQEKLDALNQAIEVLSKDGVKNIEEIVEQKKILEKGYQETMMNLNEVIGEENIKPEVPKIIHENSVDNLVDFERQKAQKYSELLQGKSVLEDSMHEEENRKFTESDNRNNEGGEVKIDDETKNSDKKEKKSIHDELKESADKAGTIGDFKSGIVQIDSMVKNKPDEYSDTDKKMISEVNDKAEEILSEYTDNNVRKGLGEEEGAAGQATIGKNDVTIDADHLMDIVYDPGDLHETLVHEETHTKQAPMDREGLIDPKTGKKIKVEVLYEGGAEKATADRFHEGGAEGRVQKMDSAEADVYKKGFKLFKDYDSKMLNQHVMKKGANAGDMAHLQGEMIKSAGIDDYDKVVDIAKDAGFNEQDQAKIVRQVVQPENIKDHEQDDGGMKIAA